MSVALPPLPWTSDVKPRLVRFGQDLQPALGGPMSRIARLGSRYALDVTLPVMDEVQGMAWIAAALQADAIGSTLTMIWPSALYDSDTAVVVNGGGQQGTNLSVSGLSANDVIPPLIPFSFNDGTRNYLHLVTTEITASSSGTAVLTISPMLRSSPANATAVNFSGPNIEGFIQGSTVGWELQLARYHRLSFTLQENA